MTTKGKRPMRALTPNDKIEAIQRVNDGESKASVARDIGVPESTLRGWCKNEDKLRYMTSRLSSPDTDKSCDGQQDQPPEKRARTESPVAAAPPPPPPPPVPAVPEESVNGLDLSTPSAPPPPPDAPVELTTRRVDPAPAPAPAVPPPTQPPRRAEPGASVSMSAISPLSGLGHLPGLTHSHLGLSFNDIATNLTLLAQLNPSLSGLSAQPASRALRSVRSPKPAHNGAINMSEPKPRSKAHHSSDPYRHSSKSSHHSTPTSLASQPVDDTLWYWLKTQQAMLDLTAQTTTAHPLSLAKTAEPILPPKPVAPTPPIASHLDYNRNSWLWQYYKQFGGAMPLPDEKLKSAAQVPKDKSSENILFSQLTKRKTEERVSPVPLTTQSQQTDSPREVRHREVQERRPLELALSPDAVSENKEPSERASEGARNHTKARTVLDSLLFNNGSDTGLGKGAQDSNDWESGAVEALQHGDKFLAWLEASGDPSVTRMHVHQLRALLHNLRARHVPVDSRRK